MKNRMNALVFMPPRPAAAVLKNNHQAILLCTTHTLAITKRDEIGLPVEFCVWSLDENGNTDAGFYTESLSRAIQNYEKRIGGPA